jgi:hypothetical protein
MGGCEESMSAVRTAFSSAVERDSEWVDLTERAPAVDWVDFSALKPAAMLVGGSASSLAERSGSAGAALLVALRRAVQWVVDWEFSSAVRKDDLAA